MIWEGARDLGQNSNDFAPRPPGLASDLACLLLAMANAALWPTLMFLLVAP